MFIVDYDSKTETFKGNGDKTEHLVEIHDKFEDALASYREIKESKPLFVTITNLKLSRARLEEIDVSSFL